MLVELNNKELCQIIGWYNVAEFDGVLREEDVELIK